MKLLTVMVTRMTLAILICELTVIGLSRDPVLGVYTAKPSFSHVFPNCKTHNATCAELYAFATAPGQGRYVGHDEPSILFYSNRVGSGNRASYRLTLPEDPPSPHYFGTSFNFQLYPAFWFGMAMCDTQSYPEQLSTCTPNSDTNIVDPAVNPRHPGTAFMELQFYPPGWVRWPAGISCSATKWCAALTIDSLSENPVTGETNNTTCQSIAGLEYVNFAFITKNGVPQPVSPPNPVQSTPSTFTPNQSMDLFMNSGDQIGIMMHDTLHGLTIVLNDETTGQSGSMTASATNNFGQVQFDPTGTSCNDIPYDFHPMYSTSSEMTRVPWAVHSYNIAFADEIGRFDYCSLVDHTGVCTGNEGTGTNTEPSDNDDTDCFPASASSLVHLSGCIGMNTGFDSVSYQPVWPDGNTALHPTSLLFTSPLTGYGYNVNYSRFAFETDLPRLESTSNQCDLNTGFGCSLIPNTDDGSPATFYPFFSTHNTIGRCVWQFGNHISGSTNDFRQNQQYGTLLNLTYTGSRGSVIMQYNDFRQVFSSNPCKA